MLPAGRIAKHGYTVKHRGQGGYFTGVCSGSDALPYEQDHLVLDADIESAQRYIAVLPETIAALYQSTSTTLTLSFRRSNSAWDQPLSVTGELVLTGKEFFIERFGLKDKDGKVWQIRNNSTGGHSLVTVEDFARAHWAGIARNLERELAAMKDYITHQGERRAAWKPNQPLTPVRGR